MAFVSAKSKNRRNYFALLTIVKVWISKRVNKNLCNWCLLPVAIEFRAFAVEARETNSLLIFTSLIRVLAVRGWQEKNRAYLLNNLNFSQNVLVFANFLCFRSVLIFVFVYMQTCMCILVILPTKIFTQTELDK